MKKTLLIFWFCQACLLLNAQYQTRAWDANIKTLRIRPIQHDLSCRPYLVLGQEGTIDGTDDSNTLEISFDELSHDIRQYSYTVKHLNADWKASELSSFEYVRGFTTQDITDYTTSNNTQQVYTHYSFLFPNEDMQLTASGNYVVLIYEDGNPDQIRAQVCFSVVQPLVSTEIQVRANTDIELSGRYQQLDIDINTQHIQINNPEEITLVVQQNGRRDNLSCGAKPNYMGNNHLQWKNNKSLVFEGGNEYHHFDAYSVYFAGTNIDRIAYDRNQYHALLMPDANRGVGGKQGGEKMYDKTGVPYIHEYDSNGQFVVNAERCNDTDSEAEYLWAHWFLQTDEPIFGGSVYIGGDIFQNRIENDNRMVYDNDLHGYYFTSFVKQGGYDYQYWFVPSGKKTATLQLTEGSHWETDNQYTVYVYFRPFGCRYDQLVGLQNISSAAR